MVLLLIAGCGLFDPNPPPEPVDPIDPMEEMTEKKTVRMPGNRRLDPIDWVQALKRERIDKAFVTEDVDKALQKSGVPVLLPNEPALLGDIQVFSGEGWYTATLGDAEHQVLIRGSRAAHSVDFTEEERSRMGKRDEVTFTRTEGIVTASFSLFGAAYNLEIECTKGPNAPACADESTARRYVKKLRYAGDKKP
ncbi:MAG: hypothetical protein AAGA48_36925 [Myxococcota bacterium]